MGSKVLLDWLRNDDLLPESRRLLCKRLRRSWMLGSLGGLAPSMDRLDGTDGLVANPSMPGGLATE